MRATASEIDVPRLQHLLASGTPPVVLDVRPATERAEWAIPGSLHRDVYEALRAGDPAALDGLALPRDRPVVAVCARGRTSAIAVDLLRRAGFDAWSLAGGMKAWSLAWNLAELAAAGTTVVQVRRTGKGCLSYLAGSAGEAVVVDASLDPAVYLGLAAERGWSIRHVLDTHVHADHLSRSRALAAAAGARLWLPEQERVRFPYLPLREGAELRFGDAALRALATPGHTLESMTYDVDARWLLSGDTLFLAAVGRPDLEAGTADAAATQAVRLHASVRRLLALDDRVVLPGHADRPVPFDGRPVAATVAEVRAAVRLPATAHAFAADLLARLPPAPPNHHRIVARNQAGELPDGDLTELEAGANRCAVGPA